MPDPVNEKIKLHRIRVGDVDETVKRPAVDAAGPGVTGFVTEHAAGKLPREPRRR